jgi:hypothetical protein
MQKEVVLAQSEVLLWRFSEGTVEKNKKFVSIAGVQPRYEPLISLKCKSEALQLELTGSVRND